MEELVDGFVEETDILEEPEEDESSLMGLELEKMLKTAFHDLHLFGKMILLGLT